MNWRSLPPGRFAGIKSKTSRSPIQLRRLGAALVVKVFNSASGHNQTSASAGRHVRAGAIKGLVRCSKDLGHSITSSALASREGGTAIEGSLSAAGATGYRCRHRSGALGAGAIGWVASAASNRSEIVYMRSATCDLFISRNICFTSASLSFFFKRLGYWSRFSLRFPQ